jgi:hypothetical protein
MKTRSLVVMGIATLIGLCIAAPDARAEEKAGKPKKDDSYGYVFTDDLLNAPGMGANAAQITVVKLGRRDRLLRPRVNFVPEMLKSVESM